MLFFDVLSSSRAVLQTAQPFPDGDIKEQASGVFILVKTGPGLMKATTNAFHCCLTQTPSTLDSPIARALSLSLSYAGDPFSLPSLLPLLRHLAESLHTTRAHRPVVHTRAVHVADGRDRVGLWLTDRACTVGVRADGLEGFGAALGEERGDRGGGALGGELRSGDPGGGAVSEGWLGVGWFAKDTIWGGKGLAVSGMRGIGTLKGGGERGHTSCRRPANQ